MQDDAAGPGFNVQYAAHEPADLSNGTARSDWSPSVYKILPWRAGALLIDGVVWFAIAITFAFLVERVEPFDHAVMADGTEVLGGISFTITPLQSYIVTCLWLLYVIVSESILGATMGKLVLGLRVVRSNGTRAGIRAIVLRHVPRFGMLSMLSLISAGLAPFLFVVEAMIAWSDERRQRLGDRMADTVVVRKRDQATSTVGAWEPGSAADDDSASFMSRAVAYLVDSGVMSVVAQLAAVVDITLLSAWRDTDRERVGALTLLTVDDILATGDDWLLSIFLSAAYFIYFNGRGATLGKKLLGIRVVDDGGNAPGLKRSTVRYIIPAAGSLLLVVVIALVVSSYRVGGLDLLIRASAVAIVVLFAYWLFTLYDGLSMLWHDRHQTIHDRMAATFVVRGKGGR